jgi:hypothetical protein
MSVAEPQPAAPKHKSRRFHLTPDRLVVVLLVIEGLLWLSERFGWLPWHKGYAVLTAVAILAAALVGMILWFDVARLFHLRFQFGIRSLLVLTVVVAIQCSWMAVETKKAGQQREAVAAILQEKGTVWYDLSLEEGYPTYPSAGSIFGERGVVYVDDLSSPRSIDNNVFGTDFSHRAEMVYLGMVYPPLWGSWGDPWGLGNDKLMMHISCLPDLRILHVCGPEVTDEGLQYVAGLKRLEHLSLYNTSITDAGLQHLEGLTKLQVLDLSCTKVTDAGLRHIERLTQLQKLELSGVTDAGLQRLKGLAQLQELVLYNCWVTDAGVKTLQRALPNCKIER